MKNEKYLETGDKHFLVYRDLETLLEKLCNEDSDFHIQNPISFKKNMALATIKYVFRELNKK